MMSGGLKIRREELSDQNNSCYLKKNQPDTNDKHSNLLGSFSFILSVISDISFTLVNMLSGISSLDFDFDNPDIHREATLSGHLTLKIPISFIQILVLLKSPLDNILNTSIIPNAKFAILHSSFVILPSSFHLRHSTFVILPSSFHIRHSTFFILHSSFHIRHSSFVIPHSSFVISPTLPF